MRLMGKTKVFIERTGKPGGRTREEGGMPEGKRWEARAPGRGELNLHCRNVPRSGGRGGRKKDHESRWTSRSRSGKARKRHKGRVVNLVERLDREIHHQGRKKKRNTGAKGNP